MLIPRKPKRSRQSKRDWFNKEKIKKPVKKELAEKTKKLIEKKSKSQMKEVVFSYMCPGCKNSFSAENLQMRIIEAARRGDSYISCPKCGVHLIADRLLKVSTKRNSKVNRNANLTAIYPNQGINITPEYLNNSWVDRALLEKIAHELGKYCQTFGFFNPQLKFQRGIRGKTSANAVENVKAAEYTIEAVDDYDLRFRVVAAAGITPAGKVVLPKYFMTLDGREIPFTKEAVAEFLSGKVFGSTDPTPVVPELHYKDRDPVRFREIVASRKKKAELDLSTFWQYIEQINKDSNKIASIVPKENQLDFVLAFENLLSQIQDYGSGDKGDYTAWGIIASGPKVYDDVLATAKKVGSDFNLNEYYADLQNEEFGQAVWNLVWDETKEDYSEEYKQKVGLASRKKKAIHKSIDEVIDELTSDNLETYEGYYYGNRKNHIEALKKMLKAFGYTVTNEEFQRILEEIKKEGEDIGLFEEATMRKKKAAGTPTPGQTVEYQGKNYTIDSITGDASILTDEAGVQTAPVPNADLNVQFEEGAMPAEISAPTLADRINKLVKRSLRDEKTLVPFTDPAPDYSVAKQTDVDADFSIPYEDSDQGILSEEERAVQKMFRGGAVIKPVKTAIKKTAAWVRSDIINEYFLVWNYTWGEWYKIPGEEDEAEVQTGILELMKVEGKEERSIWTKQLTLDEWDILWRDIEDPDEAADNLTKVLTALLETPSPENVRSLKIASIKKIALTTWVDCNVDEPKPGYTVKGEKGEGTVVGFWDKGVTVSFEGEEVELHAGDDFVFDRKPYKLYDAEGNYIPVKENYEKQQEEWSRESSRKKIAEPTGYHETDDTGKVIELSRLRTLVQDYARAGQLPLDFDLTKVMSEVSRMTRKDLLEILDKKQKGQHYPVVHAKKEGLEKEAQMSYEVTDSSHPRGGQVGHVHHIDPSSGFITLVFSDGGKQTFSEDQLVEVVKRKTINSKSTNAIVREIRKKALVGDITEEDVKKDIKEEEEGEKHYNQMAKDVDSPKTEKVLKDMADEEAEHAEDLEEIVLPAVKNTQNYLEKYDSRKKKAQEEDAEYIPGNYNIGDTVYLVTYPKQPKGVVTDVTKREGMFAITDNYTVRLENGKVISGLGDAQLNLTPFNLPPFEKEALVKKAQNVYKGDVVEALTECGAPFQMSQGDRATITNVLSEEQYEESGGYDYEVRIKPGHLSLVKKEEVRKVRAKKAQEEGEEEKPKTTLKELKTKPHGRPAAEEVAEAPAAAPELQTVFNEVKKHQQRLTEIKAIISAARQKTEEEIRKIQEEQGSVEEAAELQEGIEKLSSLIEQSESQIVDLGEFFVWLDTEAKTKKFKPSDKWRVEKLLEKFGKDAEEYLAKAERGAASLNDEIQQRLLTVFPKLPKDKEGSMKKKADVYDSIKELGSGLWNYIKAVSGIISEGEQLELALE